MTCLGPCLTLSLVTTTRACQAAYMAVEETHVGRIGQNRYPKLPEVALVPLHALLLDSPGLLDLLFRLIPLSPHPASTTLSGSQACGPAYGNLGDLGGGVALAAAGASRLLDPWAQPFRWRLGHGEAVLPGFEGLEAQELQGH